MKRVRPTSQKVYVTKKAKKTSLVNPPRKSYMAIEKKNFDLLDLVTSTGTNNFFTPPVSLFTPLAGPLSNERIGRKCTMTSFQIRGRWSTASGAANLRVLVVYDKQANGSVSSIAGIMTGVNPNTESFTNLSNVDRFVVLIDEIIESHDIPLERQTFHMFRKINLEAVFNESNITPATGAILVSFAGVSAIIQNISYSTRIRYQDA